MNYLHSIKPLTALIQIIARTRLKDIKKKKNWSKFFWSNTYLCHLGLALLILKIVNLYFLPFVLYFLPLFTIFYNYDR